MPLIVWAYPRGEAIEAKGGKDSFYAVDYASMDAGATGLIFGRNVWQRPHDESLRFAESLREILAKYPTA